MPTFPVGDEPRALAVADLDGDGVLDLVVANRSSDDVAVLPTRYPLAGESVPLAVGDFDGDGLPDVAAVARREKYVTLFLQAR